MSINDHIKADATITGQIRFMLPVVLDIVQGTISEKIQLDHDVLKAWGKMRISVDVHGLKLERLI